MRSLQGDLHEDLGVVLGKLFRRGEFNSLPSPSATLNSKDMTNILASGGRALVSDFWGRYVAFLHTAAGSTLVLRDPSGALPCFRIRHQGVSIIFSWLEDALQMLGHVEPRSVNWHVLTAQILRGPLGGRETALEGVSQVLPGEVIALHDGVSTLLWNAVEIARSPSAYGVDEATQLLGQTVRSCVRAWASCYDTLLLRLSGGVDSSILLSCLAADRTQADVICVNYHSPGSNSDERLYARLAAVRVGRDLLERERDSGFRIDRILQMACMPDPVPYVGWMNASTDARLASAYVAPAMFTGAGGDALFYEIPRWWPAADYLQNKGLDASFAAAAIDAARLGKVSVWRAVGLALKERVRPNLAARAPRGPAALLAPGFLRGQIEQPCFAHPALRDSNQLPIGKCMQTLALMHPLGYYDPFEQAAAPELIHPLFSQPLVELSLRLPTYLLTQGGHGRAMARRAFASDLPPQIASRRSKGGMEEHIKAVLHANIDFVRGLLLEGELNRRGMLARTKVEELLSGRPTALPGPVSQIHGLVAVEAWLSRWTR
ncbi:MAG: asparagine synthase [Paucibacter sp.]|nr:asparagine synthase [Roseateles sp.]